MGKAANWKWKISIHGWSDDLGWVMVALTVFMTTWAILRMLPVCPRGDELVLELNGFLAKKSIQARAVERSASEIQNDNIPAARRLWSGGVP